MVPGVKHQRITAQVSRYPMVDLPALLASAGAKTGPQAPFVLLLDNIIDPHNLGALIRTAHCAGMDGVVIPKDRAAGPTPTVASVSAGALEHIRLARVTNLANSIQYLRQQGVWVAGMAQGAAQSIFDADLTGPLAMVIGAEAKGLRPLVRQRCDLLLAIPQHGQVESLNASVAGGIAIYEAYRQRQVGRR
jgi:23S rRNA (guanosine2251-2'-O)-methyltransferase